MAGTQTPQINRIIRMVEFDLLRTAIVPGNMYMCTDTQKLYYDETTTRRVIYGYQSIKTTNDRLYNITPQYGVTYYCWEDNSLWVWINRWISLWTDSTYPSAYVYDTGNRLEEVYRYDMPTAPADDNGLLHDGSVVIRDMNRIIKGKLYIHENNDNLIITSYLGGGIRLLPNGHIDTDGEFFICDDNARLEEYEEEIEYETICVLAQSITESKFELSIKSLREIQKDVNKNECKPLEKITLVFNEGETEYGDLLEEVDALASEILGVDYETSEEIEVETKTYILKSTVDPEDTNYTTRYVNEDDEDDYFTLVNNLFKTYKNGKPYYSFLRSEFHSLNNEMYVDYSEEPWKDANLYPKPNHKYKVLHEGNVDLSLIKEITPFEIYNKLQDSSLPSPLDLNVTKLGGKLASEYSLVGHKHLSTDITDFNTASQSQALVQIKNSFANMIGEGILVT